MPFSIVTGNGFAGNAQRGEDNYDGCAYPGFGSTTTIANAQYNVTFLYRSNIPIYVVTAYGDIVSSSITKNTSNATLYTLNTIGLWTGASSIGFYVNVAGLNTTSASSIATPTSNPTSFSFTMGTNLDYGVGFALRLVRTGFGSPWIQAEITAYNPSTGATTASSTGYGGTGTYSDWIIEYFGKGAWLEIDEVNVYAV